MLKLAFALAAVTTALLLARFAIMARRARREGRDLKGDVHRWEDEGGSVISTQPDVPPESNSP